MLHRGLLEIQDAKSRHSGTIAQLCRAISSELRQVLTIGKNLLNSNTSSKCPGNMVNFGLLTAEIYWRVWGTSANFNGFRVLAALLHGIPVLGVRQTLWRWTEGATYIRQGGHHVGHWPTFLVVHIFHKCSLPFKTGISEKELQELIEESLTLDNNNMPVSKQTDCALLCELTFWRKLHILS